MRGEENNVEATRNNEPLFKFERSNGEQRPKGHLILLLCGLTLAIAVYVAGIVFSAPFLTGLALFIGLGTVVVYLFAKRKFGIASEIDVEEEMEKYKMDLIDTFNGYEVKYSQEDIDKAMAEYKEILDRETASVSDINIGTMSRVVSDNLKQKKDGKSKKRKSKKHMSARDENGNIIKLKDLQ